MIIRAIVFHIGVIGVALLAASAKAQRPDLSGPYEAVALSNEDLAAASAMALPGTLAGTQRALADQHSQQFFQQVDRISRDAMDNWWGDTGAALIDNNQLSTR